MRVGSRQAGRNANVPPHAKGLPREGGKLLMQARKVFAGIAIASAGIAHGLLGLFILTSLVSVHLAIVGVGLVAWGVGIS
jgi:hypothetical protein